tara:strand:- start:176 stop:466 length:291 start_codon:yes stop_codon:yes gene_type:complete
MPKIYFELMKFEIKTDQDRFSDKFSLSFAISIITFFAILFTNISLNINKLTRYYEINFLCRLILVDKSQSNFKKLSKLTKQLKKQKIWDFCKEFSS